MNVKIGRSKIISVLTLVWGVTATMPALQIGGSAVSNYIMIVIIALSLQKFIRIKKKYFVCFLWTIALVCTSVVNSGLIPEHYEDNSLMMIFKLVLIFLCVYCVEEQEANLTEIFLKGIYYGAVVQGIWMLLELIFWYGGGISINSLIFGKILNVGVGEEDWLTIKDGLFRPTGIGWDSATLGLLFLIAFVLAKSVREKACFIVLLILSTSRHGMMGLLILCVVHVIQRNLHKRNTVKRKTLVAGMGAFLLGIRVLIVAIYNNGTAVKLLFNRFMSVFGLASGTADSSSIRHISYYFELIDIFKNSSIFQVLFGWGTFSAGYPYSSICGVYRYISYAWTPESDFVTFAVGNGIVGFLIYYYIVMRDLKIYSKKDSHKFYLVLAILACGFMYFFARSVWTIEILLLLFMSNKKNTDFDLQNSVDIVNQEKFRAIKMYNKA